jgi:hypothetical protein
VVLRVRAELCGSDPVIWRSLDLCSDLYLDELHHLLQAAFDWTDSHLHRFALGGDVFDDASERFLCPFDVEEGDDGVTESEVRLDETLASPGDLLRYCYDYGDHWDLDLRLQDVLPLDATAAPAVCVAGDRASPPENSGGRRTGSALAGVLADPPRFDAAEVNATLHLPHNRLLGRHLDARLIQILMQLRNTPLGERLAHRLAEAEPTDVDRRAALAPMLWFLDRIGTDGLPLTAAGWMKPVDVIAAAEVVPGGPDWIGAKNREIDTVPVRSFRQTLAELGLVRRYKGRLRLTRAGAAAYNDPDRLWAHLVSAMPTGKPRGPQELAELLALTHAATSSRDVPRAAIADALTDFGWVLSDGSPVEEWQVFDLVRVVADTLGAVDPPASKGWGTAPLSPAAQTLALDVLLSRR